MRAYKDIISQPNLAPDNWKIACTNSESTLHQLSPYIGKLKSSIARDLIQEYSKKNDLVADVFCGSGTIPLESVLLGRRAFAADASLYATTLTKGKLNAPPNLKIAIATLNRSILASKTCNIDLRRIPIWVRNFYHPRTLKETLNLVTILRKRNNHFLLSCLLGISHHQRPGFLSYPSSHLVPYLRSKKFPRDDYPELYEYRNLEPRIEAKVIRALRRHSDFDRNLVVGVRQSTVQFLTPPQKVNCFITSPPYMNALDYGRDNRLRNWLLSGNSQQNIDSRLSTAAGFRIAMSSYAKTISKHLVRGDIVYWL